MGIIRGFQDIVRCDPNHASIKLVCHHHVTVCFFSFNRAFPIDGNCESPGQPVLHCFLLCIGLLTFNVQASGCLLNKCYLLPVQLLFAAPS
jgi:hypothetical protein